MPHSPNDGTAFGKDSSASVLGYEHTGLHVADLEESLRFYVDGLGLEVIEKGPRSESYLGHVVGFPGITLNIAVLRIPGSEALLEILDYGDQQGLAVDAANANPGTGHTCFRVKDVDAVHRRLTEMGFSAVAMPVTPGSGRWGGGRSVYMIDPDGIRVELVQPADD